MRSAIRIGIIVAATTFSGCDRSDTGDGSSAVQRNYQVGSFERIEVTGPYNVDVRTGGASSVSASGPEDQIERLVVEVSNGTLLIHPRKGGGSRSALRSADASARIEVVAPSLRQATIAGFGRMAVDRVSGDSFDGSVAGSGELTVDAVDVQSLKLSTGGAGDVHARSGQTRNAEYSIAGSGDIDASGIRSDTVQVSIAGSGSINGQATDTADVSIIGSGDVVLTGGARCKVSKTGSGNARCT